MDKKLDTDFFEKVVIYNLLTNPSYLGTVIGTVQPEFFNDKNTSNIVKVICDFFSERGEAPTITEVKTHLDTD